MSEGGNNQQKSKLPAMIEGCQGMLTLFEETGLNDDQKAYCQVLHHQLSEILKEVLVSETTPELKEVPTLEATKPAALKILVVDDDEVQRLMLSHALSKRGMEVTTANNGVLAIEAYKAQEFSLIIMDCQLPVMDGFDATKKIRELEQECGLHVPILAYSSHLMPGYKQRCIQSGMDDFLAKPAPTGELAEKVVKMATEKL